MMFPTIDLFNGQDIWSNDNTTFPHHNDTCLYVSTWSLSLLDVCDYLLHNFKSNLCSSEGKLKIGGKIGRYG
jgi:hypothetical protein